MDRACLAGNLEADTKHKAKMLSSAAMREDDLAMKNLQVLMAEWIPRKERKKSLQRNSLTVKETLTVTFATDICTGAISLDAERAPNILGEPTSRPKW